jgi:UDP-N-acetylmuramyl pentapeptide phosphotransferase/UDP-N-acetylglucosamine-1-phosphate transferase
VLVKGVAVLRRSLGAAVLRSTWIGGGGAGRVGLRRAYSGCRLRSPSSLSSSKSLPLPRHHHHHHYNRHHHYHRPSSIITNLITVITITVTMSTTSSDHHH